MAAVATALSCLAQAERARADDYAPAYIASAKLSEDLFWARWQSVYTGPERYYKAAELELQDRLAKAGVSPSEINSVINDTRQRVQSQGVDETNHQYQAYADYLHAAGEAAGVFGEGGDRVGAVIKGAAEAAKTYLQRKAEDGAAQGSLERATDDAAMQQAIEGRVENIVRGAHHDIVSGEDSRATDEQRQVADILKQSTDVTEAPQLNVHLDADANDVIKADPTIRGTMKGLDVLGENQNLLTVVHDGVLSVELKQQQVLQQGAETLDKIDQLQSTVDGQQSTLSDIQQTVDQINDEQTSLNHSFQAYVADQARQQQEEAAARAQAIAAQQTMAGERATIGLLSDLIGVTNPRLASQVSLVGNAAINIGQSISQWVGTIASIGASAFNPLALLNTATMVSNVVGAIQQLMGGFSEPQPTPDQMILQQIQQLQQQVQDLDQHMTSRFDRVDHELNVVFKTLSDNFSHLNAQLIEISGGVQALINNVATVSQNVDQISRDMQTFAAEGARQPLISEMSSTLNWVSQHPGCGTTTCRLTPMDFAKAEGDFAGWALNFATDDRVNLSGSESTDPLSIGSQLSRLPVEQEVNYLAATAAGPLQTPGLFDTNPLPDPYDWALAARAYVTLDSQWPDYAAQDYSANGRNANLESLIQEGETIQRNLIRIGRNGTLFANLFARYRNDFATLLAALEAKKDDLLAHAQFQDSQGAGVINVPGGAIPELIWGAADQPLPSQEIHDHVYNLDAGLPECEPSGGITLGVPSNVTVGGMLPPQVVRATRLGVGKARVCYEANWTDVTVNHDLTKTGRLELAVLGQYHAGGAGAWKTMHTLSYTDPKRVTFCEWVDTGTKPPRRLECEAADVSAGPEVTTFATSAQPEADDTATEASLMTQVQADEHSARDSYYAGMATALAGRDSSPVADAATILGGDKQLIADYINLGLPEALGSDELLHSLVEGQPIVLQPEQPTSGETQQISPDGAIIGCPPQGSPACLDLAEWLATPEPAAGTLSGPAILDLLKADGNARIDQLQKLINGYQTMLGGATPASAVQGRSATPSLAASQLGSNPVIHELVTELQLAEFAFQPLGPKNLSPPSLSGDAAQAQTLHETHGSWSDASTSYAYRWETCGISGNNCSPIPGATTQSYTLTAADVGHTIRVDESASNASGSGDWASSSASAVVRGLTAPPSRPANSSLPVVSGIATVGRTLSASPGTWSGTPPIAYLYQWQRCHQACVAIQGATKASLRPSRGDIGARLRVVVTARNSAGTATAASKQLGPVRAGGRTVAQVKAALAKALSVKGPAAKIRQLLIQRGYVAAFAAPSAGRLLISWFGIPPGGHGAKEPTAVAVASASVRFRVARKANVKISLTEKGRQLLKTKTRVKLTAKGAFTPASGNTVTLTKGILIAE